MFILWSTAVPHLSTVLGCIVPGDTRVDTRVHPEYTGYILGGTAVPNLSIWLCYTRVGTYPGTSRVHRVYVHSEVPRYQTLLFYTRVDTRVHPEYIIPCYTQHLQHIVLSMNITAVYMSLTASPIVLRCWLADYFDSLWVGTSIICRFRSGLLGHGRSEELPTVPRGRQIGRHRRGPAEGRRLVLVG